MEVLAVVSRPDLICGYSRLLWPEVLAQVAVRCIFEGITAIFVVGWLNNRQRMLLGFRSKLLYRWRLCAEQIFYLLSSTV